MKIYAFYGKTMNFVSNRQFSIFKTSDASVDLFKQQNQTNSQGSNPILILNALSSIQTVPCKKPFYLGL